MKERFLELWKRLGAKSDPNKEFLELHKMYSQPLRFYHNLAHIGNCLVELNSARSLTNQPDLVELGIWYHDAVYDPQAKDNEEKSARLAYSTCLDAELPNKLARNARKIILATKHNAIPEEINARSLVDIDLSILGKSFNEFDHYEDNIRKEYLWAPEDKFREGRRKILQGFLDRDFIYSTDFFRRKYELQAKYNLQRSIDRLK